MDLENNTVWVLNVDDCFDNYFDNCFGDCFAVFSSKFNNQNKIYPLLTF